MRGRFLLLLGFLAILTGIRWFAAASLELSPDESYYYLWAQHPDICYYSKGPGVAMAILASTALFGSTEFGIRFFSPLLALGTSLFVYFLALKLFREKVAFWSVIALNLVPIFNVGSTLMTIDPLSVFFWAASLFTFWAAIERSPKFSLFWPVTGILIGFGFLCKYTNAFALFSILFFLLVVPKYRGEFRRPNLYILLVCFSICLLPPLIWNQQHEWITLDHLAQRGGLQEEFGIRPAKFATFLAGQLGVYSPLLYIGCLIALFGSIRKAFQNSKTCFLLSFAWPILLTYAILGFHQVGEPNWTAPGLISLGILATAWWLRFASQHRWVGAVCLAGLILSGLMTWITLSTDLLRVAGLPIAYRFDPSARLRGWQTIAEQIGGLRAEMEDKLKTKVFLIGNKYQTASMLSFYLPEKRVEGPGHPPVYIPESQDMQNEFSFWPRYDEFVEADPSSKQSTYFSEQEGVNKFIDRSALYITDRPESAPPHNLQGAFNRWELVAVYELQRRNLPLREIRVFACYEYQTLPL